MSTSTERFRALHRRGSPFLLPNAWDHASALALVDAGFPALGTTSLGVAHSAGLPDASGQARQQTLALTRQLGRLPILLTVDIEGGFSTDPGEVADVAAELSDAGAVGVNLEDSRPGGELADPKVQASLIEAIKARVPGLFVNARTDPYWLGAPDPLPTSLERGRRYVAAGADGVFVPGVAEERDIETIAAQVEAPLNVLAGKSLETYGRLGVSRVSTGSLLFRAAISTAAAIAQAIRDGQDTDTSGVVGYQEFEQRLVRYKDQTA
ncbi:isocitrate lyase/PEP mutase family protein [Flindersiella endophytica]